MKGRKHCFMLTKIYLNEYSMSRYQKLSPVSIVYCHVMKAPSNCLTIELLDALRTNKTITVEKLCTSMMSSSSTKWTM